MPELIFVIISIVVPILLLAILPPLTTLLSGKSPTSRWPLVVGGILYFISWYLPSPEVDGMQTYFVTHFVGGGIFTGFVWFYVKTQMRWKVSPLLEIVSLYLLVSGLGVANELMELIMVKAHLATITPNDTWWDLVANTSGTITFWIIYRLALFFKK